MFIETRGLSKVFQLSAWRQAASLLGVLRGRQDVQEKARTVVAVDNVSLRIDEGQRVGIIGRNGAGKTTLLQMLAGLSQPTSGTIEVDGHVNCIMSLGVGLREDLSGRENIYISGEVNGKSRKEVDAVIDEAVAFAEVGDFIERPVRTYSSGMKARLTFAMITFISPEILIIDEALSVGDAIFSRKASARMKDICDRGRILIVVSHSMETIKNMCQRCIWMNDGRAVMDGNPADVTAAYVEHVRKLDEQAMQKQFRSRLGATGAADGCQVGDITLLDKSGQERLIFDVLDPMRIRVPVTVAGPIAKPDLRISIERMNGVGVLCRRASQDGFELDLSGGSAVFEAPLEAVRLGQTSYELRVELLSDCGPSPAVLAGRTIVFKVENPFYEFANPIYWPKAQWSVEPMPLSEVQ
ncbi:MAG: ABC transporter ATP-binding protein [Planctomycetaceae bacterium]|nr:ATP-binding cassette domain-containing protein [Planctomycetaceae bacterium]